MSLRLKILIGMLALGLATLAVLGDPMFQAMGFPPGSGRAVIAVALLVVVAAWLALTSAGFRRTKEIAMGRGARKSDDGMKD
jgi:hypothetical protein